MPDFIHLQGKKFVRPHPDSHGLKHTCSDSTASENECLSSHFDTDWIFLHKTANNRGHTAIDNAVQSYN